MEAVNIRTTSNSSAYTDKDFVDVWSKAFTW